MSLLQLFSSPGYLKQEAFGLVLHWVVSLSENMGPFLVFKGFLSLFHSPLSPHLPFAFLPESLPFNLSPCFSL